MGKSMKFQCRKENADFSKEITSHLVVNSSPKKYEVLVPEKHSVQSVSPIF